MDQDAEVTDTDTAAGRLGQLHRYFRERPVTGPEGHSYTAFRARTPAAGSPILYDTTVSEHITNAVTEIVTHTRAANPDAGPLPTRTADVYAWARDNMQHAPDVEQQRQAVIEARHRLEHAITAGDTTVVRPHRCPACHTIGLHWPREAGRNTRAKAVCVNLNCAAANGGMHRRWSLEALACEQVRVEKMLRECAT